MNKSYTWRSYSYLTMSIIVLLLMVLIDPIASTFSSEKIGSFIIIGVFIGAFLSIILAFITFSNRMEKRLIPIVATVITILDIAIILFFLWFGANLT
ncbi:hypothetical protein PO902_17495 (plasmid) [Planococcus maritimus]|nr:hypothetical protein [Planococcus sp. SK3692]MDE4086844.1 hypothetical protein [Planococcus maritimus]